MSQVKPTQSPRQRLPRQKDPLHLDFIRALPCVISLRTRGVEAAHVRLADARFDKLQTGMQSKPDDKWSMPLCPYWHRTGSESQHAGSERQFWRDHNINVLQVCKDLYTVSGDLELGRGIILKAHRGEYPWHS